MDAILGSACYRLLGLLSGALLAAAPLGDGGYLARVGPKPLRFIEPAPRRDPVKVLPPLELGELAVTNSVEELGPQPLPDYAAAGIDEEWIGPNIPEGAAVNSALQQRQVTPETLLQFFPISRGSNTTVITSPIEFTPPAPVQQRSSSATYISK
jgi:hypothetical protein